MPMTARNVTQSDVAEAAGASGSFPLWLTDDQPTELDKEVPICARPPTRALPRTSWLPRAASSPEVPPGRHDRGADAMRTVPRDGGPGSRRFWRPPYKQMSHD